MFRYKYFLVILIVIELVIMNISLSVYLILEGYIAMIFVYYLVFRVCERVIELIILILVIRYYGDDYYYMFSLGKF